MSHYWSSIVNELTPYVPGEQPKLDKLIKLNTNENPYGPSPLVLDALKNEATDKLRLYPDPNSDRLKQTIADYHQISVDEVFVGNGSDEVLAHTFQALLKHDAPLLFPDITYSFYPVYCGLYQVDHKIIPLNEQFAINVEDYFQVNGGIIFPNPNAPTGKLLSIGSIECLLQENTDSVVVIDEAYIDFGGQSAIPLVNKFDNLLVIQTLSKSRSLAGLRVGFAVGNASLIEALERVKNSFNSYPLDRFAISGAVAAFEDQTYFSDTCQKILSSRKQLEAELQQLGFESIPSAANFLFTRHTEKDAAEISAALRERSIIVRHFHMPRIDQYLRITVGTAQECGALITALKDILND